MRLARPKTWGYRYTEPPPTLLVFYRDQQVAELEENARGGYVFRYLPAFKELNLSPFPGLAPERGDLVFPELPTYFQERIPDLRRPEIQDYIVRNGISPDAKLQLLADLGSQSIVDPFQFRLKFAA